MVWILVVARLAPSQAFDVAIGVDIICAIAVAIVTNPALVAVVAAAPFHQRGLTDPRIVIVLNDAAVFGVVRRVQRFGVSFRKHDDIGIRQRVDGSVRGKSVQGTLQRVPGRLVRKNRVQQLAFNGQALALKNGEF